LPEIIGGDNLLPVHSVYEMRKELFDQWLESVKRTVETRRSDTRSSRGIVPKNEVARVRARLGLSQSRFAALLGITASTLKNWEQGRRQPTGAAKVLLKVASRHPKIVLKAAA
jgi:putative transcriptional regulator